MERRKFIETVMIHGEHPSSNETGSLTTPLYQTSTFSFQTAEQGEKRFTGEEKGYIYSRLGNPTVQVLEERIASLEGGEKGLAFASGMAAVSAVLMSLTKANDHILCSNGLYGCTFGLLNMLEKKYAISHSFSTMESEEELSSQLTERTTCIFVETPINPTMKVIDLSMVVKAAKAYGIPVVVDNTFCTPYLQQPLQMGCDIVIHSATKYIGGHGDVIAGLVVGKKAYIDGLAKSEQKDIGAILSPFDAWLLLRGMKTMHIRLERHSYNAEKLSELLQNHPFVKRVHYPGRKCYRQMKLGGGVIAFEIDGTKQDAQQVMNDLHVIKIAVSLGDAETLIQHPATMTHAVIPKTERLRMGISDNLLRLSVGLEAWEDLWDDLASALDRVYEK